MYVKLYGKRPISLSHLPKFEQSYSLHNQRSCIHNLKGLLLSSDYSEILKNTYKKEMRESLSFPYNILTERACYFAHYNMFASQNDELWKDIPFGAVNTLGNAGCLIFTTYNLLLLCCSLAKVDVRNPSLYYDNNKKSAIIQITKLLVEKHYRSWKFEHQPFEKAFFTPKFNSKVVKKAFKDYPEIQNCKTLDEFEAILGKMIGIGSQMFFLDELIALILDKEIIPYSNTRLSSFEGIERNIKCGIPVPMRVSNRIFHNDPNRLGGHYVILVGIENGNAILVDSISQEFMKVIPLLQLYHSLVSDSGLTCVWDLSQIFKK